LKLVLIILAQSKPIQGEKLTIENGSLPLPS